MTSQKQSNEIFRTFNYWAESLHKLLYYNCRVYRAQYHSGLLTEEPLTVNAEKGDATSFRCEAPSVGDSCPCIYGQH